MPAREKTSASFTKWLAGLGAVEEDHVFVPIGTQSQEMTRLLNERDALHVEQQRTTAEGEEDAPAGERALGASFSESLAELDAQIAAQLEADHPEAPRFLLRGLSDDDYVEIRKELDAIAEEREDEGKQMSGLETMVESNLRAIQRAIVVPEGITLGDVRLLHKKLNRGEWARLLQHVTRLANLDAETTDLPN